MALVYTFRNFNDLYAGKKRKRVVHRIGRSDGV